MTKPKTGLNAILAVWVLSLLVACGPAGPAQNATAPTKLKVYGIFSTSILEPWNDIVQAALSRARTDGKIDYEYAQNIGYSNDMDRNLRVVAETKKPDVIFGEAFGNEDAVRRVAKDYPQIVFVFGSSLGPAEPNFSVFDNWIHEPAYLSGMYAGGLTQSGTIGVVGGYPLPEVNRLVNAFILGVKETKPKARVLVSFISSWFDPAAAKDAAMAQIAAGADVLYAERQGVIDAAKAQKLYVFGNLSDQNSLAPDLVVTSPVWDMGPTVEYVLNQVKAGTFSAQDLKDFSMLARGGSSLAPLHSLENQLPADLIKKVKDKEEQIRKGLYRVIIDENQPQPVN